MSIATLIIDVQNEFFDPTGILKSKYIKSEPLISKISALVNHTRTNNYLLIWIKAEYDNTEQQMYPSHFGTKPCCQKDTYLAEFHNDIKNMIKDDDIIITKNCYSAYASTDLLDILHKNNIKELMLAGVTLKNCIYFTAVDAFKNNFKVNIIRDCVSLSNPNKLHQALQSFSGIANVTFFTDVIKDKIHIIPSENTYLVNNIFDNNDNMFNMLDKEVQFMNMFNRSRPVPRVISAQADIINDNVPLYRHPADYHIPAVPFTPTVRKIRDTLEQKLNVKLNHVLIQKYESGKDNIGEHSDKTLDIAPDTHIINVSFGATRTMTLKNKATHDKIKVRLVNNSAFVMSLLTNKTHLHSVQQDKRAEHMKTTDEIAYNGTRISLTFRYINTFVVFGSIIGQGALKNTTYVPTISYQLRKMLIAFSRENHTTNFDQMKYYGRGFSILDNSCDKHNGYVLTDNSVIILTVGDFTINDEFHNLIKMNNIKMININNKHLYELISHRVVLVIGNVSNINLSEMLMYKCQHFYLLLEFITGYDIDKYDTLNVTPYWKSLFLHNELIKEGVTNYELFGYRYSKLILMNNIPIAIQPRKLFIVNGSIPSWRVLMLFYKIGIPFEAIRLKVMSVPKETRSNQFLKINPRGKTPTLIEPDNIIMTESLAIIQYINMKYNESRLLDVNNNHLILARIQESEELGNKYENMELLFKNKLSKHDYELINTSYRDTFYELRFWEVYASKTKYIASDKLTLADFAFYPVLAYLCHRGLDLKTGNFHNLSRYYDLMTNKHYAKSCVPVNWDHTGKNLFTKCASIQNVNKMNRT